MRSRYAAFVLGRDDYLTVTWHPRTRPVELELPGRVWTGLEILDVVDGGASDNDGIVEFVARYEGGEQRERSTLTRRAGRWVYVEAV